MHGPLLTEERSHAPRGKATPGWCRPLVPLSWTSPEAEGMPSAIAMLIRFVVPSPLRGRAGARWEQDAHLWGTKERSLRQLTASFRRPIIRFITSPCLFCPRQELDLNHTPAHLRHAMSSFVVVDDSNYDFFKYTGASWILDGKAPPIQRGCGGTAH